MVNKSHPDHPKYKEEFDKIWEEWHNERAKIEMPKIKGHGNLTIAIDKKYIKKIKELQIKYKYLFTE